jgi:hypothetical protein
MIATKSIYPVTEYTLQTPSTCVTAFLAEEI